MAKATTAGETIKTSKPKAAASDKPGAFDRMRTYVRDVRSEMKRVVWPSRPEVLNSSVVVIVTLIFFATFTFLVDSLVQQIVLALGKIGG